MCAAWLRLFALGSACVASRGKPDKVRVCRAGGVCEFRAPLLLVELSPMNRLTVCKYGFALNGCVMAANKSALWTAAQKL